MHPFHMHLVNFVVQRRWKLTAQPPAAPDAETTCIFEPLARVNGFDGISRHDIVRLQSNELVELIVYFPPNYAGKFVYHCHLVEHEDMGMMLHFEVE